MLRKVFTDAHVLAYRSLGGRVVGHAFGLPMLLLTTTGRKTGKPRTLPLMYWRDGENIALIASNGGSDTSPAWWLNLQSNPEARARIGERDIRVRARKGTEEERARLWREFSSRYPLYDWYQKRTTRPIPVVVLQPVD